MPGALTQKIIDETSLRKLRKLELVGKLVGSHNTELLSRYSKMIKVLPGEFDIEKIKRLRHNVETILRKPDPVYHKQAKVNPKHHTKLMNLEDLIGKTQ